MPAKRDLTGLKVGKLTVIKENGKKNGKIVWQCKCECGNITNVLGTSLTKKDKPTQSCGCLQKEKTRIANQSEDLTGRKYGRLTVIQRENNGSKWLCKCDCGKQILVPTNHLNSGHTQSCGCLQKEKTKEARLVNLIGKRFGLLTVIGLNPERKSKQIEWFCKCDCGQIVSIRVNNLTSGNTQSCGCSRLSHGEIKIKQLLEEYNIPFEMEKTFSTCINPKTGKQLRFDFYVNNKYLIEYDGIQHYRTTNNSEWGEELQEIQYRDQIKTNWCKKNKIHLIRIPYTKYDSLTIFDLLE